MSEVFGERYVVERELARGGMGRVLLARDARLGRSVAIKTLIELGDAKLVQRFVEESQITGQLAHPDVVAVHELGKTPQGTPYLAMKLIDGQDLQQVLKALADGDARTTRRFPLPRLVRVLLKVCDAVGYAHARGVLHRDLKPANVMLGKGDEVLVMDWGLAKAIGDERDVLSSVRRPPSAADQPADVSADLTTLGAIVGTPAYMAPEQVEGASLDARADVYALGATLYELLSLRAPFKGGAAVIVRKRLMGDQPRPLATVAPGRELPPALVAIVERAMAQDPDARYPDAAAMAADLEAYLDQRAVSAHAESLPQALRRLASRHRVPLLAAAVTMGALLLAVAGAIGVVQGWRDEALDAAREARASAETLRASQADASAIHAATRALTGALHAAAAFEATLRHVQAEHALRDDHARKRGLVRDALAALPTGERADDASAPLRAALRDVARRLDRDLAHALLRQRPEALLDPDGLDALDVGAHASLLRARALRRLGRPAEALVALDADPPADDPVLASAREALRAALTDPPLSRRAALADAAVERAPGAAWLRLLRAEVRARQGVFDAARDDLEQAARLDPIDPWVAYTRLRFTTPLYGNAVMIGAEGAVIDHLAPSLRVRAGVLTALRRIGGRWAKRYETHGKDGARAGIRPEAEALLAAGALPEVEARVLLAEGALLSSRPDLAEHEARLALELAPLERDAQGILAEALLDQGRLPEAEAVVAAGLTRFPEDPRLHYVSGSLLHAAGRHDEAVAGLRRGVEAWPYGDRAHRLARCLLAIDDPAAWDDGVAAARRALSYDPLGNMTLTGALRPPALDPSVHRTLAELRLRQGRSLLASVHLMRALLLSRYPDWTRDHGTHLEDALRLGELHESLRLPGVAVLCYEEARQDPALAAQAEAALRRLGVEPQ